MNNSLKIGIVAGVIAGIVGGIMSFFLIIYMLQNGLAWGGLENLSIIPIKEIAIVEIPLFIIWGIVLGILFSRVYDLVPGKGILKGFIFGLIYGLIFPIRWVTFHTMYGYPIFALSWLHYSVLCIPLGLALGISYEFLRNRYPVRMEEPVVVKYDVKGGFYPGAIAGIVSGVTSYFAAWMIINPLLWQRYMTDVEFQLGQLGTLVMFDMVWGIVFGILFAMFYVKIPRSGVLKGLIFVITVFFFTNLHGSIRGMIYYRLFESGYETFILNLWGVLAGLSMFVPLGIVLGFLYRGPSKAPSIEQEDIQTVRMVKCIHCGASIPKDSKYCKECGKTQ